MVDGKKAAKYRVTEEELTRMLARTGWSGGQDGLGWVGPSAVT